MSNNFTITYKKNYDSEYLNKQDEKIFLTLTN